MLPYSVNKFYASEKNKFISKILNLLLGMVRIRIQINYTDPEHFSA